MKLRSLSNWRTDSFLDDLFRKLHKETNERIEKDIRERAPDDFPEAEKVEFIHVMQTMDGGRSIRRYIFDELLAEEKERAFLTRTRIGRALELFDTGLPLSPLHAFLSMCLVLETLFTLGHAEVTHKLAVRLARIVADEGNAKEKKDYYKRTKKLCNERGQVVHGSKSIDEVPEEIRKDAFALARLSLQTILCRGVLLDIYAHPSTADKKEKDKRGDAKKQRVKRLEDFFGDVDLGLDLGHGEN